MKEIIMDIHLQKSVDHMTKSIVGILKENEPSVYLYGSAVLDDFRPGWSDIDILVLTRTPIREDQAQKLVTMRQQLLSKEPENPHYRAFEGGMLSLHGFLTGEADRVVYWGTSGQRIAAGYHFDSFCKVQLLDSGILLHGSELRDVLPRPGYMDLKSDVLRHYETIRRYARKTGRELYSYGWLLDISRCIYTLRTGAIIAKTTAGEWALQEKLCPCPDALIRAVQIRREPIKYLDDESIFDDAQQLADTIQRYADTLEKELLNAQR